MDDRSYACHRVRDQWRCARFVDGCHIPQVTPIGRTVWCVELGYEEHGLAGIGLLPMPQTTLQSRALNTTSAGNGMDVRALAVAIFGYFWSKGLCFFAMPGLVIAKVCAPVRDLVEDRRAKGIVHHSRLQDLLNLWKAIDQNIPRASCGSYPTYYRKKVPSSKKNGLEQEKTRDPRSTELDRGRQGCVPACLCTCLPACLFVCVPARLALHMRKC